MKIVVTESQLKEIMGMEIGERSRSFAFTRKKRLFPKSAMKSNPDRFKKYDKEVKGIEENMDMSELDYESFHEDENLTELRNAIDRNKTVSVAFVKKDGTVRHMAIRKNLSSYVASDREKTDAQMNVEQNHNLKKVVDINSYIKDLKRMRSENRDNPNPVDDNELKQMASKKAWRSINLQNVLGFLVSGKFVDLRDENQIMDRFGPEIHGQLTKSMVRSMEQEQGENNQEEIQEMFEIY
jgi:hypothetical protein